MEHEDVAGSGCMLVPCPGETDTQEGEFCASFDIVFL